MLAELKKNNKTTWSEPCCTVLSVNVNFNSAWALDIATGRT
jgi:hypothetical protein